MRTFGSVLVRGLLVGLFAGLLAGTFAYVMGEPHIDSAIAIEEAAGAAHTHDADGQAVPAEADEEPLVSRTGQRAGLFLATSLYGVSLGGIFAVGFALFRRRLRTGSDSYAALGLAAAGFVGIVLVPFLKYPPNPPAVGDSETITKRTVTYLLTLVIGLLAVWAGVAASRWAQRFGPAQWIRLAVGAAAFLATVVVAYLILPSINEVPGSFPATLLWQFRLASLGTQSVLWLLLGLGFAAVIDRRTPVSQSEVVAA
ncbi:putative cobalt transporter CbtA [Kribbella orskensis]|uniref:Cobalt transporter CbtA n=1 Tax=Kribbella orskensis TaxID=2512216 RepID=A0ABY2BQF4_9ACTN|nr:MULTISPECIES: CbtA family protein [Kribbella]TCN37236.1 putative cobalt transporter CbtA [Kribbella sp. VKM Ac-2500]TCO27856.1 putative cobalt transporter CbtA [Kribbella orskensis]